MSKFIKLTRSTSSIESKDLYIQPMFIETMEEFDYDSPESVKTGLTMMSGSSWAVVESIEEVKEKIQDTNKIIQFDPNPSMFNSSSKIKKQKKLIDLLESQIMDLTMMSKIELGDDVIAEIKKLKKEIEL